MSKRNSINIEQSSKRRKSRVPSNVPTIFTPLNSNSNQKVYVNIRIKTIAIGDMSTCMTSIGIVERRWIVAINCITGEHISMAAYGEHCHTYFETLEINQFYSFKNVSVIISDNHCLEALTKRGEYYKFETETTFEQIPMDERDQYNPIVANKGLQSLLIPISQITRDTSFIAIHGKIINISSFSGKSGKQFTKITIADDSLATIDVTVFDVPDTMKINCGILLIGTKVNVQIQHMLTLTLQSQTLCAINQFPLTIALNNTTNYSNFINITTSSRGIVSSLAPIIEEAKSNNKQILATILMTFKSFPSIGHITSARCIADTGCYSVVKLFDESCSEGQEKYICNKGHINDDYTYRYWFHGVFEECQTTIERRISIADEAGNAIIGISANALAELDSVNKQRELMDKAIGKVFLIDVVIKPNGEMKASKAKPNIQQNVDDEKKSNMV